MGVVTRTMVTRTVVTRTVVTRTVVTRTVVGRAVVGRAERERRTRSTQATHAATAGRAAARTAMAEAAWVSRAARAPLRLLGRLLLRLFLPRRRLELLPALLVLADEIRLLPPRLVASVARVVSNGTRVR